MVLTGVEENAKQRILHDSLPTFLEYVLLSNRGYCANGETRKY